MKSFLIILSLVFLTACGHIKFDPTVRPKKVEYLSNKKFWVGKDISQVLSHPLYSTMQKSQRTASSGTLMYIFVNKAHNQGATVVCNHVFAVKAKTITDFSRTGNCGPEDLRFRPRDESGQPILDESEFLEVGTGE